MTVYVPFSVISVSNLIDKHFPNEAGNCEVMGGPFIFRPFADSTEHLILVPQGSLYRMTTHIKGRNLDI
jgi:hypothetical protein